MPTVAESFAGISLDRWRSKVGFSFEVETAQKEIFSTIDKPSQVAVLERWLQTHQPCLFGRLAARFGQLGFCVLDEDDLQQPDTQIQEKIQRARTEWTADAFDGHKSGFVLYVLSPRISVAEPSSKLFQLARRICMLYLQRPIEQDTIYYEDIFLEKPGPSRQTWQWRAGVNYFCANADGRWWQDHRIPGGMAFSVNSVGHMAKAGKIAHYMKELDAAIGSSDDTWSSEKVDDLGVALKLAMQTISLASEACSGKATWLKRRRLDEGALVPQCPIALPASLADKDHCSYAGYYHTDITLPSEYFRPEVERPHDLPEQELDFTYLFHDDLENADHAVMGIGHPIRETELSGPRRDYHGDKRLKVAPLVAEIAEHPRLLAALATRAK